MAAEHHEKPLTQHLARVVLASFVLTFMAARIVVFLIMSRRMPDLYLHLGGTHVHHLNYGIFLLSAVGAYLVFARPAGRRMTAAAVGYAIGLGLTFVEFGMWLHLSAALLGLIATAPALNRFRQLHKIMAVVLLAVAILFGFLLNDSFRYAGRKLAPALDRLEEQGPPE